MSAVHSSLAAGRWGTLSLMEQLGNVGSEIERALGWKEKASPEHMALALDRGLELIDLTIADRRWKHRLFELLRMREVICDYFFGENSYASNPGSLRRYFLSFGIAARAKR